MKNLGILAPHERPGYIDIVFIQSGNEPPKVTYQSHELQDGEPPHLQPGYVEISDIQSGDDTPLFNCEAVQEARNDQIIRNEMDHYEKI